MDEDYVLCVDPSDFDMKLEMSLRREKMSTSVKEVLKVDNVSQYGVTSKGVRYSWSKFIKDKTVAEGDVIAAEIYTGPKGGKYINTFTKTSPVVAENVERNAQPALPPALPPTTVNETPAPMGIPPVAPANKESNGTKGLGKVLEGKTDWAAKDKSIETQAVLKSVLESPAYAQLVVGKRRDEAFSIGAEMFKFFLEKFYEAKS